MATFESDQVSGFNAKPVSKVEASQAEAETRIKRFSFDNTGGTSASPGDDVELFDLPPKARVVRGRIEVTTAFGSGANINIGTSGDNDKYTATAVDADSTGATAFANNTSSNGMLSNTVSEDGETVLATFDTAGGNGAFEGFIEYVQV